jgi:hypothetical protein
MVACKEFCGKIGERGLENHSSGQFLADLSVILERIGQTRENFSTGKSQDTCFAKWITRIYHSSLGWG